MEREKVIYPMSMLDKVLKENKMNVKFDEKLGLAYGKNCGYSFDKSNPYFHLVDGAVESLDNVMAEVLKNI